MKKLFAGQSVFEVWDKQGSTMLHVKLNQESQARKEFALCLEEANLWNEQTARLLIL